MALYLAKTEGRGTVRFFKPEMDARIQQRRMLEQDLQSRHRRRGDEFELYYQPHVNLDPSNVGWIRGIAAVAPPGPRTCSARWTSSLSRRKPG